MVRIFFGWQVVAAASAIAVFSWGIGFYGPPIFLNAIHRSHGWPVPLISAAFTCNLLLGAIVMTRLASLHGRFGVARVTQAGAVLTAAGLLGWATATEPWQLFAATPFSASGWALTSGAALNAMIAPWFNLKRPTALSIAYSGASLGGIIFSPLWVALIGHFGFPCAAIAVGAATIIVVWFLAGRFLTHTPSELGLGIDGGPHLHGPAGHGPTVIRPADRASLWRDRRLLTQAAAASLALFAQIGLMMQLFSLLLPAMGPDGAGTVMAAATAAALAGRSIPALIMRPGVNRRLVAMANGAVQIAGSVALLLAAGQNVPLLVIGSLLFGLGLGNTASLPALIAQGEFTTVELPHAVALVLGISQGCYAFAPLAFGALRVLGTGAQAGDAPFVFAAAALCQVGAVAALWTGIPRRRRAKTSCGDVR